MRSFLKIFFASFIALIVFSVISFFIGIWTIGSLIEPAKPDLGSKGVLVVDLGVVYREQAKDNPLDELAGDENADGVSLYDAVRLMNYAAEDSTIKGIYIKGGYNPNGFATNEELRAAIADFKRSRKFVIGYGEVMDQKSYYTATIADQVYCHPMGGIDWDGFAVTRVFMKGLLDKLGIEPEVFYAGRFKSATEPFRVTRMTDANRIQMTELLNDLYGDLLTDVAVARNIDTTELRQLAQNGSIRTGADAQKYRLVDGLKYDDEIKSIILKKLGQKETDNLNFITLSRYAKAVDYKSGSADERIAVIYAEGDIIHGKSRDNEIGSEDFIKIIRKARTDKYVKAIVFRVNSPGGSSLASDEIWREITLAKKEKPVVVSMGDYAASGGYYISCNADSIFADKGTITGSIGVFSILANMEPFFNNKLGITFDRVKTAPFADMGTPTRELTETEKRFLQSSVDTIYGTFKQRVADGRNADINFIDSIAQGHVYSGKRATNLKLVDRTGTLQDAVNCAADLANLDNYSIREYPEKKSFFEELVTGSFFNTSVKENVMREKIGAEQYNMFQQANRLKQLIQTPQARMPFDFNFQ